jgi:hypothetical protein
MLTKNRITTGFALLTSLGLFSGCTKETVDSQNINTAGIAALIEVTATTDSATTVITTLKVGGAQSNTYVDLSDGDAIFAKAGATRVEMTGQSTGVYEAEFNTAALDTEITVSLERKDDDAAPNSRGLLPGPFALTIGASSVSRTADLAITWTPSGSNDDVTIELSGTCISGQTIDVPGDPGTHTITANTLKPINDMMPESCDVNVEVTRSRQGTADVAFDSESRFRMRQIRTSKFTSTP